MTMKLPQKAGFVPTIQEWDQLVNVAEYIAQRALKMEAERDACRDAMIAANDAADLLKSALAQAQQDAHCWATLANSAANERDAARAEVTRRVETEEFGRIICPMCKDEPAPDPAQPDATMLSDNSLQTSSQAPARGRK